ncbi:MAG: MATE family efflux transporter [Oscillospiraceae bacterium]|nr:MATE family efflux transporter [Oscillospiraceae bacterium]
MAEIKATLTGKDERFLERSLNGPMLRVILYIGTPLALYQGLNMLFMVLDTMMASHISKESVSAVAYLSQLNLMLSAVGGGLAVGAGIQISRAYGEGNFTLVRKRVSSLYVICLAVGLVMLVGILPFTNGFLRLAGTPDELIAVGAAYFAVELIGLVVKFLNNVYIAVERARGNSRRIMYLNFLVIAVKLSLTAVFVYLLHGDLVMIAVASLASQMVMLVFAVKNSLAGDGAFSFSKDAVCMDKETTRPMITQSIPVITEKVLFAFGKTVVNSMSTVYGATMVGALGVANNLGGITTNPQNGYQEGASAIISQNFGAGKYRRVLEAFYATVLVNVVIGAVISGLELWQLDLLARLFDSGSEAFHEQIALVYRYEALGAVPLGVNAAVLALLYGLGMTRLTLLLNFARVFIFRIPVFWVLQHWTNAGEASVGMVMLISNFSSGVLAAIVSLFVIRAFKRRYLSTSPEP